MIYTSSTLIVQCRKLHFLTHNFLAHRCPSVDAASPCTIVQGDHHDSYPLCCPRVECPTEDNEVEDQVMMASHPAEIATYDVVLDDNEDDYFQVLLILQGDK